MANIHIVFNIIWIYLIAGVSGLSSAAGAGYVNIVGIAGGITQSLPTDYVKNFQRWQVDMDYRLVEQECDASRDLQVEGNDLQVRPALDILLKGGAPTYVMAGLSFKGRGGQTHPCPLARQWTVFSFAVEPSFRLEAFVGNDDNEFQSLPLLADAPAEMKEAMESFGILLSQLDETSPLSEGFHIVSLPLSYKWVDLPEPAKYGGGYSLVCLATAEPNAEELLRLDDDLVEMTASSVLEVTVVESKRCSGS